MHHFFNLLHDLPHVHLHHHHGFRVGTLAAHDLPRKGPQGLEFQKAQTLAAFAPALDQVQGRAGRRPVGDHDDIGIVEIVFLVAGQQVGAVFDLVHQVADQTVDHGGIGRGKTPHVVVEPGDVVAVHTAEVAHGQASVLTRQVGVIVDPALDRGAQPLHQGQFPRFGNDQFFAHVAHHLVEQKNDRRAVGFGQVEGLHRHLEDVLVVGGREGNDGMVAVGSPAGLHHIALAAVGGNAGGRAAALHVDHAHRHFRRYRQSQAFAHQ